MSSSPNTLSTLLEKIKASGPNGYSTKEDILPKDIATLLLNGIIEYHPTGYLEGRYLLKKVS